MANEWVMALEQRADTSAAAGSAADAADAVRRGADLRVHMTTDVYEETLIFQQTYPGEGGLHYAIIRPSTSG